MQAWENFLATQERELGAETVKKWLRPLKVVRFDACNLYLEAVDSFQALWFEEHIRHKVKTRLCNNNNKSIKVHIVVAKEKESAQEGEKEGLSKSRYAPPSSFSSKKFTQDSLDPDHTFNNFVASSQNLLPYHLLTEASGAQLTSGATAPFIPNPPTFNPIYIYGGSGVGKTHLLMAAAQSLISHHKKVLYIRAETFTEHVVHAIRSGEMQLFRKTYRNIDALLLDDLEIFSKKAATQEEFFHTFNTLHVEGKQIILTASCPPQDLKAVEPRLISRFEWGIVLPLHPLNEQELELLLRKKIEQHNFFLQEKTFLFLISSFKRSAKALIKAYEALILRTHLNPHYHAVSSQTLTVAQVKNLLGDLIQEEERSVLTPDKIISHVAEYYGILGSDILSKSQSRECALPRQIAMHLCRDCLKLPYVQIGDLFARDHSTVMTSVKQIQKAITNQDNEIVASLKSILKRLENMQSKENS